MTTVIIAIIVNNVSMTAANVLLFINIFYASMNNKVFGMFIKAWWKKEPKTR